MTLPRVLYPAGPCAQRMEGGIIIAYPVKRAKRITKYLRFPSRNGGET